MGSGGADTEGYHLVDKYKGGGGRRRFWMLRCDARMGRRKFKDADLMAHQFTHMSKSTTETRQALRQYCSNRSAWILPGG